jgi:2-oxoglutarate ferredoxin oxidoreductase subunit alpha
MILGDGILGQMMEPLRLSAPKRSLPSKPWALGGCRGRSPNIVKSFYLREGDLEKFNLKLQKKYAAIESKEQRWQAQFLNEAKVVLVAYGTLARIAKSAIIRLRAQGKKVGLIRPVSLWPFPEKAFKPLSPKTKYLVIEMSYGQMVEDVRLAVEGRGKVAFLGRSGGGVPTEEEIIKTVNKIL